MSHYGGISYQILGGVLIVVSSLVTESMSSTWKRRAWIIFGVLAFVYSGLGIYLDTQAEERETKREARTTSQMADLQTNMKNLLAGNSSLVSLVAGANSEMA